MKKISIRPGIYKHWKGRFYRVLMTAVDSETRELLVIYIPLYGVGEPTVRTAKDFTRKLKQDGYTGRRFWRQGD